MIKILDPFAVQKNPLEGTYYTLKGGAKRLLKAIDESIAFLARMLLQVYLTNVTRLRVYEPVGQLLKSSVQWCLKKSGFPHLVAQALAWSAKELATPYATELVAQQAGFFGSYLIWKTLEYALSYNQKPQTIDPIWQLVDYDPKTKTLSSVPINIAEVQVVIVEEEELILAQTPAIE